jgi:microcompartment protein CcmL/EutN
VADVQARREGDALGFVETFGLVTAIEVADAMGKAARVCVKTVGNADAGLLSVICEGDLAACRAAVDAGKAAATRMEKLLGSNIIARPYADTQELVERRIRPVFKAAPEPAQPEANPAKAAAKAAGKGKSGRRAK